MIVERYTTYAELVVSSIFVLKIKPSRFREQIIGIISTNLEITSIFAQTYVEHVFADDPWLHHGFIDWYLRLDSKTRWHAHSKNSISCLFIEKVSFSRHTSKRKHKSIKGLMIILSKVNSISYHKPLIWWSFLVSLIELAFISISACTLILFTIIYMSCITTIKVIPFINMISTRIFRSWIRAIILAGYSRYWASCIYN